MIDVWSVIGGMIGGTLPFIVSGMGKWLKKNHNQRKEHQRWLAQQERIRDRREAANKS